MQRVLKARKPVRTQRDAQKLAAKFPIADDPPFDLRWGTLRRKDGTIVKP